MSATPTFRCEDVDRLWATYLDQSIADADADAIEAHAADCTDCERRVMRASDAMAARARTFAPAVPADLRDATLRAVSAAPRRSVGAHQWWRIGLGVAAAAAITLVVVRRSPEPSVPVVDSTVASVATDVADTFESAALRSAAQLADEQARSEFRALDEAMAELDLALKRAPDDAGLRAYRSTVRARRAELSRRVKDATS